MRSCNEEEIDQLRAQLAAVTAERDEDQGMIHGAKELVSESLRALKHAEKAITREAWQSGPTIEEARKVILDASKNIEEYGVEGYAGALKLARQAAVMRMNALRSANDALKAATERAEKAEADVVIHWAECEAWRAYCNSMPHALEHAIELDGTHYQPCFRCLYEAVEKAREATDATRKEGTT